MTWSNGEPLPEPPDEGPVYPPMNHPYDDPTVESLVNGGPPERVVHPDPLRYLVPLLERVVVALETIAQKPSSAPSGPPGASGPPIPAQSTGGPPAKPEKTIQEKRGGLIFFACKDNGWSGKSAEVGEKVLGYSVSNDARTWSEDEQKKVLAAFKDWGWIEDRR